MDAKCQNCDWKGAESETNDIKHLYERVAPGEPFPSGECPECGAFCLPVTVDLDKLDLEATIAGIIEAAEEELETRHTIMSRNNEPADDLREARAAIEQTQALKPLLMTAPKLKSFAMLIQARMGCGVVTRKDMTALYREAKQLVAFAEGRA